MLDLLKIILLQRRGSSLPKWLSAEVVDGDIQHQEKIFVSTKNFKTEFVYISQRQGFTSERLGVSTQNFVTDFILASEE